MAMGMCWIGLGCSSVEAARQREKTPAWAEAIVRRHKVGLVMIYPDLLVAPASWVRLGSLCEQRRVTAIGNRCALFYASDPAQAVTLAAEFRAFAQTMPAGTGGDTGYALRRGLLGD